MPFVPGPLGSEAVRILSIKAADRLHHPHCQNGFADDLVAGKPAGIQAESVCLNDRAVERENAREVCPLLKEGPELGISRGPRVPPPRPPAGSESRGSRVPALSAFFFWVMSRATLETPMTCPAASRMGEIARETSRRRPSLDMRTVSEVLDWLPTANFGRGSPVPRSGARGEMRHGDRLADDLMRRVAKEALSAGVPREDHAVEILADDGVMGGFDDRRQTRLGLLGALAFADVAKDYYQTDGPSFRHQWAEL